MGYILSIYPFIIFIIIRVAEGAATNSSWHWAGGRAPPHTGFTLTVTSMVYLESPINLTPVYMSLDFGRKLENHQSILVKWNKRLQDDDVGATESFLIAGEINFNHWTYWFWNEESTCPTVCRAVTTGEPPLSWGTVCWVCNGPVAWSLRLRLSNLLFLLI